MKMRTSPSLRARLGVALGLTLVAGVAHAQHEVAGNPVSWIWTGRASVPNATNNSPAIVTRQFSADYANTGGSGPRNLTTTPPALVDRYPSAAGRILMRSTAGGTFAAGVPRYLIGDVMTPPITKEDRVTPAPAGYWRLQPVKAGESFSHTTGSPASETKIAANTALAYHYSAHAERVFASQSGRVTLTWVTTIPGPSGTDGFTRYRFFEETFAVSAATSKPVRKIYWTEKSFNSPVVNIPTGTIESVSPVYNGNFPQTVAEEYKPVGVSTNPDPTAAAPAEKRTLWFEKTGGIGQLHAYNVEGRVLVEYLGPLKEGQPNVHHFLGADIVEVARVAPSIDASVELGKPITPRDRNSNLLPLDQSSEWLASPVLTANLDAQSFYGTTTRADGVQVYYAERENSNPDRVVFYWLEKTDAAIHFLTAPAKPNLNVYWPQQRNNYIQVWPSTLSSFAHYTVPAAGSTTATGIQFPGGQIPQVVYQDDPAQTETRIDATTQRLISSAGTDGLNRTLLKFTAANEVWYVPLFTQADTRSGFQEGDGLTAISTTATVGSRLEAPSGYLKGGFIASGSQYLPSAYLNPFVVGVTAAESGAIIPVNAMPGANVLKVWWFKSVTPASASFQTFYLPTKVGTYTVSYPASPSTIVMASNAGSGDLSGAEAAGSLYYQNDPTQPGYNPNEEHALLLSGRVYALRNDLNVTTDTPLTPYTSEPFALLSYLSPVDNRPAVRAFKVLAEQGTTTFSYPIVAGTILQGPMPLPLLPLPIDAQGNVKNTEAGGTSDAASSGPSEYSKFTYADRKGYHWVYRGRHSGGAADTLASITVTAAGTGYTGTPTVSFSGSGTGATATVVKSGNTIASITLTNAGSGYTTAPTVSISGGGGNGATATAVLPALGMKFYYTMREGFYVPGLATQPAVGTILPYLRESGTGDPVTGTARTILYRPSWPANAPELRVAETLTLPKFGLPDIYSQSSAEVLYQQAIATGGPTKASVTLHDPIREKTFALGAAGGLSALPTTARTTINQGKTYFQGLPPHLQSRFFFDPLRGTKGALVLLGTFVDEIAGEDYLNLNVLSAADKTALEELATGDASAAAWTSAIGALTTRVETFIPDPLKAGSYKAGTSPAVVGPAALATVQSSDTAVVNYALTATGAGSGWVTMIFGNGRAFTPAGEPVAIQVFKVAPRLYDGDLKVLLSSNPLDEKVTLRHSGDFAARPQDYEFEWRYATSAAATYSYAMTARPVATWTLVQSPAGALPTAAEYAASALSAATLSRTVQINAANFTGGTSLPGLVLKANNGIDFTSGVPAQIVFSADLVDLAGFVLYVNGAPALAHNAPATFTSSGASTFLPANVGLSRQFTVDRNFFQQGVNTVELALYSTADAGTSSVINFNLHVSTETDLVVAGGSPWIAPGGADTLLNQITLGGSPTAPLGSPLLVMRDNYFTMRYRPKTGTDSVAGATWSRWTSPKLIEGWIKRVLAAINPFNQRMRDLSNTAVNTDVSLLTQSGKRWEGDVALNLDNINDFGLIEIYETVLNRGKTISIDAGFNDSGANNALLLATGYLADLYTILGNEAYADAANPTISIDDSTTVTEVNTSRFSFESQVSTILNEELALLRGRDDFLTPGVIVAPAYNRLYWNFTRGINSGEALYSANYNIREKAGSATEDGTIDAADAQRMFPQGHGDAYGHYLTALKGYYRLLWNPTFTWTPRSEAVTVLGQAVEIDYFDERKFSGAAASVARTAQQVLALTHRESYRDDAALGWTHFRDGKNNSTTGLTRHWGLDEWSARAGQGALFNWVVGNAILPDQDNNPTHTGVQVIDRSTVPELAELTTLAADFQSKMDNANARLNPLGLSPGAIAFDISPSELKAGKSHYEQIYERSLRSVLNAKGAFDQAARMTRLLRNQENQITDYNTAIVDQERAFVQQLIDIYGSPYPGEVGPGKLYAQNYAGPDTFTWFIVDRPTDLVDTSKTLTISTQVLTGVQTFTGKGIADITASYTATTAQRTLTFQPNRFVQWADQWAAPGSLGQRSVTGRAQQALLDQYQAEIALRAANEGMINQHAIFRRSQDRYAALVAYHLEIKKRQDETSDEVRRLRLVQLGLQATGLLLEKVGERLQATADNVSEFLPKEVGFSNDVAAPVRGAVKTTGGSFATVAKTLGIVATNAAKYMEKLQADEKDALVKWGIEQGFTNEEAQAAYEHEVLFRNLIGQTYEIAQLATTLQRSAEQVRNVLAEGDRVMAEREIFRKRAAALIQGYRTRDLTFRAFRNEALEQYRTLFDLAARYTYLAAKSYDYETGLLGSTAGQSVISGIVASRALGDLTNGVPQATVSTLGDSGLAGTMARLQADWSVAKPRLGINNPDINGTLFSLRRELFRITDDTTTTDDDTQWQQILEQHIMSNVLADADVATHARNLRKPDGSAVPGIVIPFSTTIQHGMNFFGLPSAPSDHNFSASNFATKIYAAGLVLRGYVGMDPFSAGTPNAGGPASTAPNALNATPYVYLIPVGTDYMLAPPLGDTGTVRAFNVRDQALPLPFNLGATQFSTTQFFNANGTLSEQPWILRKHQAFRPVHDPAFFYTTIPAEFTSSRLVGRSAWNGRWKLVIPAYSLLNNEQDGLNRFVASVKDIELFLRTYSNAGN